MQTQNTTHKPSRPENPSALEMAIYNFELKAKEHYERRLKASEEDKELLKKLERDLNHLENEKKRLLSIAVAQDSLDGYRAYTATANRNELRAEEHHPTDKMVKFLASSGEPKPSPNHQAHHIVPGKGQYRQALMMQARLALHKVGIGINDPRNGVWLLNYRKNKPDDWATPESVPHANIHRYNYETWIGSIFASLNQSILNDKTLHQNIKQKHDLVETRLLNTKVKIKNNLMPAEVMQRKNANWDGSE